MESCANTVKKCKRENTVKRCNPMLRKIFEDTMALGDAGADINSYACEFERDSIVVHCWDGRRYMLTCAPMVNGCAYDAQTGEPIGP
jgi:hypothetical protein